MKSRLAKEQRRKIFETVKFGSAAPRNRVVMAPMVTNFAGPDNEITDRQVSYYAERARGGVGTIIDNPDTSVNTSARLGQYVKGAGEVFAGITIEVDPDIDFNSGVFSIDVNSQAVRQLLFKLEGLGIEQVVPTSGTGWETLTYDFSSVAGNIGAVTAITLIMDVGKEALGSPVELEYAVDLDRADNGKPSFFILQIKPMMGTGGEYTFDMSNLDKKDMIIFAEKSMGNDV